MSDKQNPTFNSEIVFLKVLIEGKADLYEYQDGNLIRFFYRKDDGNLEQLVYKRYKISTNIDSFEGSENKIGVNSTYKQQLWNELKCPSITMSRVERLSYKASSLLRFFVEYNTCKDEDFVNYEAKEKRDFFNLNIRPGVNFSSLVVDYQGQFTTLKYDLGSQVNFRIGLEAEVIFGFNKNKWALILEPTFQYFSGEAETSRTALKLDYKSIEIPLGFRYYMFLNDKSKIFINAQYCYDFNFGSKVESSRSPDLDLRWATNQCFGLGYKYNDKISIEARYFTSRGFFRYYRTPEFRFWSSKYNTFSVILGYTLF